MENNIYKLVDQLKEIISLSNCGKLFSISSLVGLCCILGTCVWYRLLMPTPFTTGQHVLIAVGCIVWLLSSVFIYATSHDVATKAHRVNSYLHDAIHALILTLKHNFVLSGTNPDNITRYDQDTDALTEQLAIRETLEGYLTYLNEQKKEGSAEDIKALQNVAYVLQSDLDNINEQLNRAFGATRD